MSFSVVGMSLEPYTLQIGTRIISKVSYLLTNKIIWYVARSRRGIFPSHFFTMGYSFVVSKGKVLLFSSNKEK